MHVIRRVRDCDIQFEASYGWAKSSSLLQSMVLLFFLFIHFFSHTLAQSFSGRSVQWTSVLWQVCMPITPETASSTSETGSLPGFRPCCRYTHTLTLTQARTFPPTHPHAHHLCAKVGCEISLLISIVFILNTCLNVILFPQKKGVNFNTDTATGAQTGMSYQSFICLVNSDYVAIFPP